MKAIPANINTPLETLGKRPGIGVTSTPVLSCDHEKGAFFKNNYCIQMMDGKDLFCHHP